jgi:uncharacterized protein (TIGR03083 family)
MAEDADMWALLIAERKDFADFLDSLTAEQWDTQSLCTEWKVRDAAAHVVLGITTTKGAFIKSFVKNGFNFNKSMSRDAREFGARSPEVITKELRAHTDDRTLPPGTKPPNMLGDTIVHQQDCRRPLGMLRQVPPERLHVALDAMKGVQPVLGNRKRVAGLSLIATDMDWTCGDGAEVRGTGEALLMAMNGRSTAIDELTGDGVETLRSRV